MRPLNPVLLTLVLAGNAVASPPTPASRALPPGHWSRGLLRKLRFPGP